MSSQLWIGKGIHVGKGIALSFIFAFAIVAFFLVRNDVNVVHVVNSMFRMAPMRLDAFGLRVWVVHMSDPDRKTLAHLETLPSNAGMVFVFDAPGRYRVSTVGMKFPVDAMWIAGDASIVHIEHNIKPERVVTPPQETAMYILLVRGGTLEKYSIDQHSFVDLSRID